MLKAVADQIGNARLIAVVLQRDSGRMVPPSVECSGQWEQFRLYSLCYISVVAYSMAEDGVNVSC